MNVYFACSPGQKHMNLLAKCKVKNLLLSYHFIKSPQRVIELLNGWEPERFIIDSGAFSVWANGGSVDIESYSRFCKEVKRILPEKIKLSIVNLDVLPGKFGERPTQAQIEESAEKGWDNMLFLEKEGLKVIHVFHQHEDFKWLDKMMKHSDYIGLSPANDVSMNEKHNFLNKCFSITKDKIKTHGFAVTSHTQLYNFPFYSVDSSSWTAPGRFGRIPIFTDDLKVKSVTFKDKESVIEHWHYIKQFGIDKLSEVDWQFRTEISIKTYQKLEEIATNLWTKRGVVFKD